MTKQKGFTLIEILVVIGIIAVLAAIVLIAINPARQFRQANDSQRTSNVNAILNAIGQYVADNKGSLPSGIPAVGATAEFISMDNSNLCAALVPKYLPALPIDPTTGVEGVGAGINGDEQVSDTECDDDYNTGYKIQQVSVGRIKVSATGQETTEIAVTR